MIRAHGQPLGFVSPSFQRWVWFTLFSPTTPHHYMFTLMAIDLEPNAGLTRDEVIKALDGKVKQTTGIIGVFSKP
jgi:phosphatidylethanolamine-binding protein (PEBP) family uncharacterized protein